MFLTWVPVKTKWPVAPASAMAISMAILILDVFSIMYAVSQEWGEDQFVVGPCYMIGPMS